MCSALPFAFVSVLLWGRLGKALQILPVCVCAFLCVCMWLCLCRRMCGCLPAKLKKLKKLIISACCPPSQWSMHANRTLTHNWGKKKENPHGYNNKCTCLGIYITMFLKVGRMHKITSKNRDNWSNWKTNLLLRTIRSNYTTYLVKCKSVSLDQNG